MTPDEKRELFALRADVRKKRQLEPHEQARLKNLEARQVKELQDRLKFVKRVGG